MADFDINVTNGLVRKWRRVALAISDYNDPAITIPTRAEEVWDLTNPEQANLYTPKPLPTGAKVLGYITTDGISDSKEVSSEGTDMLQSLEPVRTDVQGIEKTLQMAFGESNAWTNALRTGLPVSQWPTAKHSGWGYADGRAVDYPYYTLWLLAQDGVASNAFYRLEIALKAKVTAMGGRKMNASDAEVFDFTFGLFKDDRLGLSHIRTEEGPGYQSHLTVGQSLIGEAAAVTPVVDPGV